MSSGTVGFFGFVLLLLLVGLVALSGLTPGYTAHQQEIISAYSELFTMYEDVTWGEISTERSHGDSKHGGEADIVRNCLNQNGELSVWLNPNTDYYVRVCQISPTLFGIQVVVDSLREEVTAYFKSRAPTYEKVVEYLVRNGHIRVQ